MWQPIETAPRDGRNLLLWLERKEYRPAFCCIGRWVCMNVHHRVSSVYLCTESCARSWETGYHGDPPTHWMPLPNPPEPSENVGTHENHVGTHEK
jgi:hypothetical protein